MDKKVFDPDSEPAGRGSTVVNRNREEALWPCVKTHSLHLVWDKQLDRIAASIIVGSRLRTEEEEG